MQLFSEAPLHIKDSEHTAVLSDARALAALAVLHLSPFSVKQSYDKKHSEIRLFKLICSILTKALPTIPQSQQMGSRFKTQNSCSYPVIVVSVSWTKGMDKSKVLSDSLCSGLAL